MNKVTYEELLAKLKEISGFRAYIKVDSFNKIVLGINLLFGDNRKSIKIMEIDLEKNKNTKPPFDVRIFDADSFYNDPLNFDPFEGVSMLNESLGDEKIKKIKEELWPIASEAYKNGIKGELPSEIKQLVSDYQADLSKQFESILK